MRTNNWQWVLYLCLFSMLAGCGNYSDSDAQGKQNLASKESKLFSLFESGTLDFGSLPLSSSPKLVFTTLQNRNQTPIKIASIEKSCGCLNGKLAKDRLAPGESTQFAFMLDATTASKKSASIKIDCIGQNGVSNVDEVFVRWNVIPTVQLEPPHITIENRKPGDGFEAKFLVSTASSYSNPQFELDDRGYSDMETEIVYDQGRKSVLVRGIIPSDRVDDVNLRLCTRDGKQELGSATITVRPDVPLRISPAQLHFGPLRHGESSRRLLTVRSDWIDELRFTTTPDESTTGHALDFEVRKLGSNVANVFAVARVNQTSDMRIRGLIRILHGNDLIREVPYEIAGVK